MIDAAATATVTDAVLHVLIIDDDENDALLAKEELRRGGYDVTTWRVDTAAALAVALTEQPWDVILCDYTMPSFTGLDALALLRQHNLDIPFILMSGTIGEESAVAALKAGADDYIMKPNLTRLVPSVQRELREVAERRQRQRMENALRASEERYRLLVETSPDAITLTNLQGIILMANQQVATLYHLPDPALLIGRHALDLLVLEDRDRAAAAVNAMVEDVVLGIHTYTAQRQDGTTFSLELRSTRVHVEGAEDSIMTVARDVTERMLAAQRLRFQAHLLDTVGQAIIATDVMGVISYWNHAAEALYGWTAAEVVGQNILAVLPMKPFHAGDTESLALVAAGHPASGEYWTRHRTGHMIPVLATAAPVYDERGTVVGITGVSTDNTARKEAEERLTAERDLLETLMNAVPDAIYIKDAQSRFVRVNNAQARFLGAATPAEMVGKTDFDYFSPDEAQHRSVQEHHILATGEPLINDLEYPQSNPGHGRRSILASKVPIRQGEQITGLVGISRDITALKQAEEERERFFTLSLDLMCVAGLDGNFKDINPAFEKTLGFTPGELCTEPYLSFVHPDDHAVTLAEVAKLASGISNSAFENRYRCKDGGYRWLQWTTVPMPAEGLMYATARDITEQKEMKDRQRQQIARISALHAIDNAIASSGDLRMTLGVILEQVCTQLGVDAAQVLLLDEHTLTLGPIVTRGFRGNAQPLRLRLGQGHAGQAALEQRLIVAPDFAREEIIRVPLIADEHFVAYAAVPLLAKGQVQGVLEVFHRAPLAQEPEWQDFLLTLAGQAAIAIDNARLTDGLQRSNLELRLAYDATIEGWSRALDLRDKETEGHSQRVTTQTLALAQAMGLSSAELVHMRRGALLHDIGKMGIPDAILLKEGPLTEEEWVVMRKHPTYAYELLVPVDHLRPALDIPYCHHEKWDGSGYPRGLAGEQIPLAARIFAVVDVADALLSDRPYRAAWSSERVKAHIAALSGSHFDPAVVAAFQGLS